MNIKVVIPKKLMEKLQERYAKKRGIKGISDKVLGQILDAIDEGQPIVILKEEDY